MAEKPGDDLGLDDASALRLGGAFGRALGV